MSMKKMKCNLFNNQRSNRLAIGLLSLSMKLASVAGQPMWPVANEENVSGCVICENEKRNPCPREAG
jgi:hypothetical protein